MYKKTFKQSTRGVKYLQYDFFLLLSVIYCSLTVLYLLFFDNLLFVIREIIYCNVATFNDSANVQTDSKFFFYILTLLWS